MYWCACSSEVFKPLVLGTQPIVRLARRCPPRQTAGLPAAKQAAPFVATSGSLGFVAVAQ